MSDHLPNPDPVPPEVPLPPGPPLPSAVGTDTSAPAPRPPVRSAADRLLIAAAIVALALVFIGLGAVALERLGQSGTAAESPSTTESAIGVPSASASASAAVTGGPSTTPSPPSTDAQVAAVEAQVPPIRGLQPKASVPTRVIDEAQLRAEFTAQFDKDNPPALLAAQQALLERLGLVQPGQNLRALILDAETSQVLGFYDDQTKEMTIVERSGAFGPVDRLTLAHEYTHALQDQLFGLESLGLNDPTQGDRSLARTALVEGDASLAMTQWAQRYLTPAELMQVVQQSSDPVAQAVLDRLPPIFQQQLAYFPYLDGEKFVAALYARGGWAAVDRAYASPPDSTAQILHPDLYLAGKKPVAVTLGPVAQRLGQGWKESAIDTEGELGARVWLEMGASAADAASVAAGWSGDRVASYDGPGGAWALVWTSEWDTTTDADAFASDAATLIGGLGAASLSQDVLARRVTILVASDPATLNRLRVAAGVVR